MEPRGVPLGLGQDRGRHLPTRSRSAREADGGHFIGAEGWLVNQTLEEVTPGVAGWPVRRGSDLPKLVAIVGASVTSLCKGRLWTIGPCKHTAWLAPSWLTPKWWNCPSFTILKLTTRPTELRDIRTRSLPSVPTSITGFQPAREVNAAPASCPEMTPPTDVLSRLQTQKGPREEKLADTRDNRPARPHNRLGRRN